MTVEIQSPGSYFFVAKLRLLQTHIIKYVFQNVSNMGWFESTHDLDRFQTHLDISSVWSLLTPPHSSYGSRLSPSSSDMVGLKKPQRICLYSPTAVALQVCAKQVGKLQLHSLIFFSSCEEGGGGRFQGGGACLPACLPACLLLNGIQE